MGPGRRNEEESNVKIAVLGSASSSVHKAPFQNEQHALWMQGKAPNLARAHGQIGGEWDIWGCSPGCWAVSPRATRWFEVHRWEPYAQWFGPEYSQFLRDFKGILYTGGTVPEFPNHVVYPIDRIEEKFSSYFLTSSLALMVALAIDTIEQIRAARTAWRTWDPDAPPAVGRIHYAERPNLLPAGIDAKELDKDDADDVIGLWGVDMAANEEYAYQRPGCQFFLLEAMRRGIGVFLPPESDLMRPMPVYGISEWDHNYIKLTARARELSALSGQAQSMISESNAKLAGLQGEQHALQYFVQTWTSPYGMLPGMVIRQAPGTGLGSGIEHFDGRPIERMAVAGQKNEVLDAMANPAPEQVAFAKEIMEALRPHAGETGRSEGAIDVIERLGQEGAVGRTLTAHLQHFAHPGETTEATLKRVLEAAVAASKPAKARKKRRR